MLTPHPFRYNNPPRSSLSFHPRPPALDFEQEYSQLREENLVLATENRSIRNTFDLLTKSIPAMITAAGTAVPTPRVSLDVDIESPVAMLRGQGMPGGLPVHVPKPPAQRSDTPKVIFGLSRTGCSTSRMRGATLMWTATDRVALLVPPREINVTILFVSDSDGNVIDGFHAPDIRSLAHQIWVQTTNLKLAPPSWQKGSLDVHRHFSYELCDKFPEMALCNNDWKVRFMATHMYSSWHTSHFGKSVKTEEADITLGKRRCSNTTSSSKRTKIEAVDHTAQNEDVRTGDTCRQQHLLQDILGPPLEVATALEDVVTKLPSSIKIISPLFGLAVPATSAVVPVIVDVPVVLPVPAPARAAVDGGVPAVTTNSIALSTVLPDIANTLPLAGSSAAGEPAKSTAKPARVMKDAKIKPGTSKTLRNLCLIDWCPKNPGATREQYAVYWDSIVKTPAAEEWSRASAAAVAARKKAAA
ncbi:hypothetical protein C8J57DRAFT_1473051 [Mycena rebaudengoi]|nr:hypothetical protein C8J57DRAFT_1473051 [Mycena rebaudengoi]